MLQAEYSLETARDRLEQIRARMETACERVGPNASEVLLIGASKTVPAEKLQTFVHAGLEHCGENYVQEGVRKIEALQTNNAHWHFIGALQSNKAREVVQYFEYIHSVDRASIIRALEKAACEQNKIQKVLIQVNLDDEASKAGCALGDVSTLVQQIATCKNLKLCGMMCLPPYHDNAELTRPYFRKLRRLRDEALTVTEHAIHLSMGMSNDFEIAIEEGATMVRLGTVLFGKRN